MTSALQTRNLEDLRELKVRLPIDYHVRLHSLKILTGQSISAVVSEALGRYLAPETAEAVAQA